MYIYEKIIQSALYVKGVPSFMSGVNLTYNEDSTIEGISFNIDVPLEYFYYLNKLYAPTVCDIPFGPSIGELVETDLNTIQNARNGNFHVSSIRIPLKFNRSTNLINHRIDGFVHNEFNLQRIGYAMRMYSDYYLYKLVPNLGTDFCSFVVRHLEDLLQESVDLALSVNDKIKSEQQICLHRNFHFSNEWGGSEVKIVSVGLPEHAVHQIIAPAFNEISLRYSNSVIRKARRYLDGKLCSRHVYAVYYDWCGNELSNIENAVLIPENILKNQPELRDFRKVFVKELTNFTRSEWQHMVAEISHARRHGY